MDTGSAFQVHAETALNDVINKYFDRAVSGIAGLPHVVIGPGGPQARVAERRKARTDDRQNEDRDQGEHQCRSAL